MKAKMVQLRLPRCRQHAGFVVLGFSGAFFSRDMGSTLEGILVSENLKIWKLRCT